MRIINRDDVRSLLPMAECICVMEEILAELSRGKGWQPLRSAHFLPGEHGLIGLMPGGIEAPDVVGLKALTIFPGNEGSDYESHQGAVLLFEAEHGALTAILDASEITAIRTAAVSAVATRHLSSESAEELAILGSGTQARTHLDAIRCVRPIQRVRVWSRSRTRADEFSRRESRRWGIPVEACPSPQDAVAAADIVCTVTGASEPVLRGDWLIPGVHVNAVGACTPRARELDGDAVARARLVVDRRESALAEAGDFILAKREGRIGDDHIRGELGEVIAGTVVGRTSPDEITIFESLGLAVEDLAAARFILDRAEREGVGTVVDFGGRRS